MIWAPSSSFLKTFEVAARAGRWLEGQWSLYIRTSLSGAEMTAELALSVEQQNDCDEVKQTLLSTYEVSTETYRRLVFEQWFVQNNADAWLRNTGRVIPNGWTPRTKCIETVLVELSICKLPKWLETYMPWQFRRAQRSHSAVPGKSETRWHLN